MQSVVIYTDGGCWPNPGGVGGWGVYFICPDSDKRAKLCGGEVNSTNNRMEMMAAIMALETLSKPYNVKLYTDSQYLRKGIKFWVKGWLKNGWMTSQHTPVKNKELWQRLLAASKRHNITWKWVKGHSGNAGNEIADALAQEGKKKARIA